MSNRAFLKEQLSDTGIFRPRGVRGYTVVGRPTCTGVFQKRFSIVSQIWSPLRWQDIRVHHDNGLNRPSG